MPALRRPAFLLLCVAALAFAAFGIARTATALRDSTWNIQPWPLVAASAIELGTLGCGVFLWSRILARFDSASPGFAGLLRAWRASTLAKYLPGSVWSVASTVEVSSRLGVSPVALPSSFLIQGALNLAGAVTVAVLAGPANPGARLSVPPWLAVLVVAGALALVHPRVLNALITRISRIAGREPPRWEGSWPAGATLLLLHMAAWAAYGVAFAFFLSAIVPGPAISWVELIGINAIAFVAGFVAVFAPGGVGVREAALVGLLGASVPALRTRVAVAAASRLWLVLTEVAGGALVTAVPRPRRASRSRPSIGAPLTHGARAELLTDTRAALAAVVAACDAARQSIWIAQLAFDADCVPQGDDAPSTRTLLEAIVDASRRRTVDGAPLDVRIVLNGGLLLDTAPALRKAIAALGAGPNVQLRAMKAFPQVMHAKTLVVDGDDAFLTGASFVNGYWDDARHVADGAPGASPGTAGRPLHDAAVRVRGAPARALGEWFIELWDRSEGADASGVPMRVLSPDRSPATRPDGTAAVQVLRTMPDSRARPGRTEILDAYLEAIGRAQSFIYLESQYFSARPIARAVRAALDANAALEVVLVLNQNPDVTAYRAWQDARLRENGLLGHPRFGAFALWSAVPSFRKPGRTELTQVFVHSKAAVIDDRWATLGTANLDGASLHSYGDDFTGWAGRRLFGRFRNFDLNVALHDGVDGDQALGIAAMLRRRLWSRHLGLHDAALVTRPANGWLPLWRAQAAGNVAALGAGAMPRGHVLPYVPEARPRAQLAALGIDLHEARLDLRFDPGWLETHFSPGWMLKILPERVRAWL